MNPLLDTDRWTRGAFLMVVVSAIGVSLWASQQPVSVEVFALTVLGGAAYVVLGIYGTEICDRRRSPPLAISYLVLQLTIAAVILEQIYGLETLSIAWIILLPLIAQSLTLVPPPGAWIVAAVSLAIFLRLIVLLGGWKEAPAAAGAFLASCLFVVGFTRLALSAEKARRAAAQLAEELATAHQSIAAYAVEATELATVKERARLAREIHDSVGHCLTVANIQIEAARSLLGDGEERAASALEKAQAMTREGLADIRRSVTALRASPLDGRSLVEALTELVGGAEALDIEVTMKVDGRPKELPLPVELTLYRATQEGLTNVRKHAQASNAEVHLDYGENGLVKLMVCDNGVGRSSEESCEPGTETEGFGLFGLNERVRLVGGQLEAASTPGRGWTLQVEIPV